MLKLETNAPADQCLQFLCFFPVHFGCILPPCGFFFSVRALPVFLFSGLCFWLSLSRSLSLLVFFFFTFLLPPCFPFLSFVHSPGFFRVLAPGSFLFSFPLFRSTRDLSPFLLKRSLAFIARDKNVVSSNHKVW